MLTTIKVGSSQTDITYYIKESGLSYSTVERSTTSHTMRDGTLYKASKDKEQIKMSLLDMSEEQYQELKAIFNTNPIVVRVNGTAKTYYHSGWGRTVKKTIGTAQDGITYITGASITLEEK